MSAAYVEGDRLLREKYDPKRCTVTTFLAAYLFGRVEYELIRSTGRRKRPGGWIEPDKTPREAPQLEPTPAEVAMSEEQREQVRRMLESLPERSRAFAEDLMEGMSLEEAIARHENGSRPLFDASDDWRDIVQRLQEALEPFDD